MNHHYADIRSRITEPPQWWDEHAVPRYVPFSPKETANIYARECALIEIACQGCGALFNVAWSRSNHDIGQNEDGTCWVKESKPFDPQRFHYGDPPNAGCCPAGPTMNSEPKRVLESWRKDWPDWVRQPEKEGEILP